MKVYNTLSRQKEDFTPQKQGEASMYCCGPTVYNFAHIGNMRTYLFMDWLRRGLHYNGFSLRHVMNITDVGHLVSDSDDGEDKMEKGAREQKKTPWEIAEFYTGVFMKDIGLLNIETPEIIPRATGHIEEMINYVTGLCEKGFGYEISDGIYFDVSKFPGYGKLSRINLDEQEAGARVEVNPEKRHPADFALWKKAPKEHIMQWPSLWGQGYPGWHIECSAMSLKYLGERFDIHTGGVDHIPVHHENEIAQSEGYLGHEPVKYWMHGEFMLVDGGKMSKSLGNTYTVGDLQARGFDPMHFRYLCANAHYRNKMNFTWEALASAKISYNRLLASLQSHKNSAESVPDEIIKFFEEQFEDAVNDDLNIPKALGIVWSIARRGEKSSNLYELAQRCDKVLGLKLDTVPCEEPDELPDAEVEALIEARQAARREKNFAEADRIRDTLKEMGILLEDTKDGVKWKKA